MSEHLLLPDPRPLRSRRAGGGGGGAPRRQQNEHADHLQRQLNSARAPRRLDAGVDPALVFKLSAAARPDESVFERHQLQLLGETADYTYFVIADDQGGALGQAIEEYRLTGNLRSFFALIDDIEVYGPEDRRGPGLDNLSAGFPGRVTVDIGVWVAGTYDTALARVQTVERVLAETGDTILLRSVSARRTYLRANVTAAGLTNILDTSVVEFVRTPPVPFIDFREWRNIGITDVSRAEKPGAIVGVLDDAPAATHPLLDGVILSVDSLAPNGYPWQQPGSHGTEVAGRILYPHLAEELRDLLPLSSVGTVRAVRILEPDPHRQDNPPRFASYAVPHELIDGGIRHLHEQYKVKVINLSVGYNEPFSDVHLSALTETIDDLIRELDIVVVVPTGNVGIDMQARTPSGHHVLDDKPEYFFTPEHRLAEPGPAALALTVGSIAISGAPAEMPNRFGWRAVAEVGEASAFSRSGPGLGTNSKRANKPDIVHFGGNVVLNDSGSPVLNDLGASVLTTSSRHDDGRLFAAVNGTSFAAPAVARVAADVVHAYPDASANLVRALVGSSTVYSHPAQQLTDPNRRLRVYGHGIPRADRAIDSDRNRVTMTYDGQMDIDTVQIHPLPMPEEFRRGHHAGERAITVALAFDPPVRRQRREYLACTMKIDIYRNIDPDDLADILVQQDPSNPQDLVNDLRRLKLNPGSNTFTNATLQVRSWARKQAFLDDEDTFYIVVTHKAQTWARNSSEYTHQRYALAATLEDQNLVHADLRDLLTQRVHNPARVRIRA